MITIISGLLWGCVTEFVPDLNEKQELLVVEGIVTDRPDESMVRLSYSVPLGEKNEARPVKGCYVTVSDNLDSRIRFMETEPGLYRAFAGFKGEVGRTYTLHIETGKENNFYNYVSEPVTMKPVSPINRVYYERIVETEPVDGFFGIDGCKIFVDTGNEPECKYYRWDFNETWELRLLYPVENILCWVSDSSRNINIKSTAAYSGNQISGQEITYISNETDRLKRKYSIEVSQYSISEDEYTYLDKLKNLSVSSGGLYDRIPASIPNNITCIEEPALKTLGFFSVSAKTTSRLFIQDKFDGIINHYTHCLSGRVIYGDEDPDSLNVYYWVLIDHPPDFGSPRTRWLTFDKGCADCTVRGSKIKPSFWIGD